MQQPPPNDPHQPPYGWQGQPPQQPQWQGQPPQPNTGYQQQSGPQWPQQQPGTYPQQQPPLPPMYLPDPGMMPPPRPPRKKLRRRTWIIIGVIVLVLFIASIANSTNNNSSSTANTTTTPTVSTQDTTSPTDTPVPTDTPTPQPSLAYQLADIDAGGSLSSNDPGVAQYQTLLDTLHRKTGDSEQTISDETVAGRDLVRTKYGKDVTLLALLQDVDQSVPDGATIHYNEALAAYITLAYGS